jgi:hypothetical protein
MPYMLEVINLYSDLYNPNTSKDWEDIYSDIKSLEFFTNKEIKIFEEKDIKDVKDKYYS